MNIFDRIHAALSGDEPVPESPTAASPVVPPDHFQRCVAVTLAYEGGFADNPADPGGATNFGITLRTLEAFVGHPVTVDDVRDMSESVAQTIYRANYWDRMRCGDLPAGVDLMVFDFGVNSGTGESARTLQRLVDVAADGDIGNVTLAAVANHDAAALISALAAARGAFLEQLPTFAEFGDGWMKRVEGVAADAGAMTA